MNTLKELSQDVITTLKKNNKTVFTAESCTAGLITATIADIEGASQILLGGLVSYSNRIKQELLVVSSECLENYGAVSFECVTEMAKGALALSKADYVIAITGIAGPDGGTKEKPVGTVFIAILTSNGGWAQKFSLEGTRKDIRTQSVELCLQLLLATEKEEDFFDLRLRDAKEI